MWRMCACSTVLVLGMSLSASAQDPVRLPGQGQIKRDAVPPQLRETERLIPGGGLLVSFDTDGDGRVSDDELLTGIDAAFLAADQNEDGYLTPLEQISWSESLPTRDASLSNPARFDPNLDRRVNPEEFSMVITGFAEDVADSETGEIIIASLRRTRPERPDEAIDAIRSGGPPGDRQARRRTRNDL